MNDTTTKQHSEVAQGSASDNVQAPDDYLLLVAHELKESRILHHFFAHLVMHAQALIPYDAQPHDFREALNSAKKVLGIEAVKG